MTLSIFRITRCLTGFFVCGNNSELLICFEAWAKLAQQQLVCAPLGIHLEPINKRIHFVSDNNY